MVFQVLEILENKMQGFQEAMELGRTSLKNMDRRGGLRGLVERGIVYLMK